MYYKTIKNELIKFMYGKKIIIIAFFIFCMICLSACVYTEMQNIAVMGLPKSLSYSNEFKSILTNMSGINFSYLVLTEILYKPILSFYLVFIALIAIDVFAIDSENGTRNTMLNTGISAKQIIKGKLLFMFLISMFIVLFNFIISIVIGKIVFAGNLTIFNTTNLLVTSLVIILPALSVSIIIALLSESDINSKLITLISIGMIIILGFAGNFFDSFRIISPIGAASVFNDNFSIPKLNGELILCATVSFTYFIVVYILLNNVISNKDYY